MEKVFTTRMPRLWAGFIAVVFISMLTLQGWSAWAGPDVDRQKWLAPVDYPLHVGKTFDPPQFRWLPGHRGVDLCPGVGSAVRAPRRGIVIYAGMLADRPVISIRHRDGLHSTFEPVDPNVQVGQNVDSGMVIGHLKAGHGGDCLHWGVKVNRDLYLNPLALLLGKPVLKPWDSD